MVPVCRSSQLHIPKLFLKAWKTNPFVVWYGAGMKGQCVVCAAKQWEEHGHSCDDATRRALRLTGVPSAKYKCEGHYTSHFFFSRGTSSA